MSGVDLVSSFESRIWDVVGTSVVRRYLPAIFLYEENLLGIMAVDKILVPIDGSEQAQKAVEVALNMGKEFGSDEVHALFVVDTALYSEPALSFMELITDEVQEAADDLMEQKRADAAELGIELLTDVVHGPPKETIVEQAESIGADLIVIGQVGEASRYRHGPVCKYVAKHAPCNVLVV